MFRRVIVGVDEHQGGRDAAVLAQLLCASPAPRRSVAVFTSSQKPSELTCLSSAPAAGV